MDDPASRALECFCVHRKRLQRFKLLLINLHYTALSLDGSICSGENVYSAEKGPWEITTAIRWSRKS